MRKKDKISTISMAIFVIGLLTASVFSAVAITPYQFNKNNNNGAAVYAQSQQQQQSSSNATTPKDIIKKLILQRSALSSADSLSNFTAKVQPSTISNEELNIKMAQLSSSNKPEDIATLAYIWGFSPITTQRTFNWDTSPNTPPATGHGPANAIHFARELVNASFTDVVSPNANTLYGIANMDLTNEPLVLKVPPISDRYYSFQFLDAYTNDYAYAGTRATGSSGGTYLIAGPDWNGQVPEGMTKIWIPTNLAWVVNRILVKGPADVPNVNAIQDQISVTPLSEFQGGNATATAVAPSPQQQQPAAEPFGSTVNASTGLPISPAPANIPATGIKLYDQIGQVMIGNPLNPPDPGLVVKLESIGIGPGKMPSTEANDTIKAALQTGITEGEKLIDAKVANIGSVNNGWSINTQIGVYGTDYLTRAAITKFGFGGNIPQEAFYPTAFTDIQGGNLTGANNYTIHFEQIPPVDAFWSVTMYNNKSYFVNNPINRYSIGGETEGLKNNTDGSVDIYVQPQNPGAEKESNWLPAPTVQDSNSFSLIMRMYLPQEQVLNGTWPYPTVQRTTG